MLTRYQHIGDPGEFGDWIVAVIALADFDQKSLAAALSAIVTATSDLEHFLQLPEEESAMHFSLRFSIDGTVDAPLTHERDVWPHIVKIPELRPAVAQYVRQINGAGEANSFQDEGHARGAFAISELMLIDPDYCRLFGELLFEWDMDHETFQFEVIDRALRRYGWTPQTYDLFAARTLASGQHIREQWCNAFAEPRSRAAFDVKRFAHACKPFVERSIILEIGLNEFADVYSHGDQRLCEQICRQLNDVGLDFAFEASEFERNYAAIESTLSAAQHWDDDLRWTSVEHVDLSKLVRLN